MATTKKTTRAPGATKSVATKKTAPPKKTTPPTKKAGLRRRRLVGPATEAKVDAKAPVAQPAGKQKLVRDSFTIPEHEYAGLATLKARLVRLHRPTKKSELLRAGLVALAALDDVQLRLAVDRVPSLKTGRPKASKGTKKKS